MSASDAVSASAKAGAAKPTSGTTPRAVAAPNAALQAAPLQAPAANGTVPNTSSAKATGAKLLPGDAPADINRPKVAWPFPLTTTVKRVPVAQIMVATPAQTAYALKRGRRILAPYQTETTQLRVVFEVPLGGAKLA